MSDKGNEVFYAFVGVRNGHVVICELSALQEKSQRRLSLWPMSMIGTKCRRNLAIIGMISNKVVKWCALNARNGFALSAISSCTDTVTRLRIIAGEQDCCCWLIVCYHSLSHSKDCGAHCLFDEGKAQVRRSLTLLFTWV